MPVLPTPKGENVVIITGAGGSGVLLSDACVDNGLKLLKPMPADLDAAFRKFIPPFGAAGNPVDITGGEPPITYMNTVRLGLEDDRIHALILGYWHTIMTPPMVFARNMVQVVEEMRAKGIEKPIVASLAGDVRGGGSRAIPVRARHSGLRLLDRDPGGGAGRQVPVGACCRACCERRQALPQRRSASRASPPSHAAQDIRERKRRGPKGRRVGAHALAEVRELLGTRRDGRDLLIEHLHRIQDRFGCLSADHLAALAEEMRMAQAEVYEVATFYHHFDIVKEGEAAPPALTVRVCDGLSCEMAGARELLEKLPPLLGREVRVHGRALHRPLRTGARRRGRPEPGAACDRREDRGRVQAAGRAACARRLHRPRRLPAAGGYKLLRRMPARRARRRIGDRDHGRLGPARPGRRGLSGRAQVAHRAG